MPSTVFLDEIKKQRCKAIVKFLHNGIEYKPVHISQITFTASMEATTFVVTLADPQGYWEYLFSDMESLAKEVELSLYLPEIDEAYTFIKARTVSAVNDSDGTIKLVCRSRKIGLADKFVGAFDNEVTYNLGGTWDTFPSQIAWDLMTTYGDLSGIPDYDNPDIAYAQFQSWASWVDENFLIGARYSGQSVQHALEKLGTLTNSFFYINPEGKLAPASYFIDRYSVISPYSEAMIKGMSREITLDGRTTYIKCSVHLYDDAGQLKFSTFRSKQVYHGMPWGQDLHEEDMSCWHFSVASAENWMSTTSGYLYLWGFPIRNVTLEVGLPAFLEEIGNTVEFPYGSLFLTEITLSPMELRGTLRGIMRWDIT